MPLFIRSQKPLSQHEIFTNLKELRSHARAPYSNYLVASIVEIKISDNSFFYVSGVNVENDEHNRLSIHSEQNAISNAVTLLGKNTKFTKIWVMAAAGDAVPEEKQKAAKPCGHCRQIMVSLAQRGAEIYVVSLNGESSSPDSFEKQFLPGTFN